MTKEFRLKIKDKNDVFSRFGKLRMEDFISLSQDKRLNKTEQLKLENTAIDIRKGTKENKDWFYQKSKKGIRFF